MHHLKTPENLIGYNFSTVTLFWDKLFGTYRHYHQPENMEVGIEKKSGTRVCFLANILSVLNGSS
jgi:sterol desaturase/sphingolipid hydroxylase (fatty acid hydroxylase superfamily)